MPKFSEIFSKYGITALFIIVAFILLSFAFNKKSAIYYFKYVAFCLLFIMTVFSGMNLFQAITVKGGEYGTIATPTENNQVEITDSMDFDFKNVVMTKKADGIYSAQITSENKLKLDADSKYLVFVNGAPCNYKIHSDDYIVAEYSYLFYDKNFKLIESATLTFKVKFDKYETLIILESSGDDDTTKLWNDYFNKNDFIFTIKVSNEEFFIDEELLTVTLMANNEVYKEIKVIKNYTYNLPEDITLEGFKFNGWIDKNGNSITKVENVSADTIVTANLTRIYTITLKTGDEVFKTEKVLDQGSLTLPEINKTTDTRIYDYWVDTAGNKITKIEAVSADMIIYAHYINLYKVTININGSKTTQIVQENATLSSIPADPTKTGYTFKGWQTEGNSTFLNLKTYKITGNVTINAVFERGLKFASGSSTAKIEIGNLNSSKTSADIAIQIRNAELMQYLKTGNFTELKISVTMPIYVIDASEKDFDGFGFNPYSSRYYLTLTITPNGIASGKISTEISMEVNGTYHSIPVEFSYSFGAKDTSNENFVAFSGTISTANITSACKQIKSDISSDYKLIAYGLTAGTSDEVKLYLD